MRLTFARFMILGIAVSSASIAFGQDDETRIAKRIDPASESKARDQMDQLLAEWERRSVAVTSLQVVFERIDQSKNWGDQVYQGQAFLKSPDFACLEFKKAIADAAGKPAYQVDDKGQKVLDVEKEPFQRIVWTEKEVLDFEFDEKAIYVYPLVKGARPLSLRQFFGSHLSEMPFFLKPILFNMKAAEVKQRYDFTLLDQNEEDYTIAVVAREKLDKQSFERVFIRLNKSNFLPSRLTIVPTGGNEKQEFRIHMIRLNQAIPDQYFHPSVDLSGWRVDRMN